jgi:hypothetical protein
VQARFVREGLQAQPIESSEELGRSVQAEIPNWAEIVKIVSATTD